MAGLEEIRDALCELYEEFPYATINFADYDIEIRKERIERARHYNIPALPEDEKQKHRFWTLLSGTKYIYLKITTV
jgi:hypothetical protein